MYNLLNYILLVFKHYVYRSNEREREIEIDKKNKEALLAALKQKQTIKIVH